MKEKEMIEEMARVIENCTDITDEDYCDNITCDKCRARILYNIGYRKIPKDSVVLSREEYNETLEQFRQEIITLSQELVNSRKETVEKFAKMVYATLTNRKVWVDMHNWWLEGKECPPLKKILNELSKQFGVEIKE